LAKVDEGRFVSRRPPAGPPRNRQEKWLATCLRVQRMPFFLFWKAPAKPAYNNYKKYSSDYSLVNDFLIRQNTNYIPIFFLLDVQWNIKLEVIYFHSL
jgi:hypothetical protein